MLRNYLLLIITSLTASLVSLFILREISLKKRLFFKQGVPLVGGIAMGFSFIIICAFNFFLFSSPSILLMRILMPALIMLVFGIIDDRVELSVSAKIITQLVAAGLLIFSGIRTHIVYIGDFWNIAVTLVWIIGITNAFNHLDIIDGLAGVTVLIVSCAFLALSFLHQDLRVLIIALSMIGITWGFLFYNLPPAKVYMGNAGSHFLGFVLAAVALTISYATLERKIALLSPLLILGLPIFDTFFLMLIRLKNHRSVFKKSNDHFILRLLKLGYTKNKALAFMVSLAVFFSGCGVLLSQASNRFGAIIILSVILASLVLMRKTGKVTVHG